MKKFKFVLYSVLFLAIIAIGAMVGVLAVFEARGKSSFNVNYKYEQTYADLQSGISFTGATEVVFDFATNENLALVSNYDSCTPVASGTAEDILLYKVMTVNNIILVTVCLQQTLTVI